MHCARLLPPEPGHLFDSEPPPRGRDSGVAPPPQAVSGVSFHRQDLQHALARNAPVDSRTESTLATCIRSVLSNSGSLFRAELSYGSARAQGFSIHEAEVGACALEYFHVASLILDDLPLMDDSLERRGCICPHLLYGEGTAVLAALALITRAYALLGDVISCGRREQQGPGRALVERCLGTAGVLNGQARDLGFKSRPRGAREVKQVALQKTVPLIQLALVLPGLLAGAPASDLLGLSRLSICWGLLYQGIDDFLDLPGSSDLSGKSCGRDSALRRPNAAHALTRSQAGSYLNRLVEVAQRSIACLIGKRSELRFLQEFQDVLTNRRQVLAAV